MTHHSYGVGNESPAGHRRSGWWRAARIAALALTTASVVACSGNPPPEREPSPDDTDAMGMPMRAPSRRLKLGVSVLLEDSIKLIAGKRVALITNQTGVDANMRRTIDLLATDPLAQRASVKLVRLFSPEHGITGTADRTNLADETDQKTGLVIHSLYQKSTIPPPDSLLRDVDVLVVDLQDIGTRTWTYVGVMLYAMHAGARNGIPVVVLDRPNPITGSRTEGALLDSALANPNPPTAEKPGNGFALFPMPLRHGLTMGELARFFQAQLKLPTRLTVVPMKNWRRDMWMDDTKLPWVRPSPNLMTLKSALLYPALVPFESSNVSVGRGSVEPFTRFGAPWMKADTLVFLLEDLSLSGVRFRAEKMSIAEAGDGKYSGKTIPGIRIDVLDRDLVQPARVGAAILWALSRVHRDSLRINNKGFDERMGSASVREAILAGADPDAVMDRQLPGVLAFEREARKVYLYR